MSAAPTSPARWFAPVPGRRVGIVRRLTFGYALAWLLVRLAYVIDVTALPVRRFEPVGIMHLFDSPPGRVVVLAVWLLTLAGCAGVVVNRHLRVAAPIGAAGMFFLATLTSSYGQVFHTEHLLVLHLGVLAAAVLVESAAADDDETSGWPLNLMMAIVVVTYVLAGVAKLRWSGIEWVTGDILQNWIAIDNLRKLLFDDLYSPVGGWLSSIGWVWMPIALATIVVEIGAPLALVPGRIRTLWLLVAWGFHVGVFVLMAISFPYQVLGVAYAAFLPMEHIADEVRAVLLRRRRAPVPA